MESEWKQTAFLLAAIAAAVLIIVTGAYLAHVDIRSSSGSGEAITNAYAKETDSTLTSGAAAAAGPDSVDLSDSQLASVKVEPVGDYVFPIEKGAVGSIDFNQEMSVQVFTPYQGRIVGLFAKVGDEVKKGQTLFTIDSPDLLQAESSLIAPAGGWDSTTSNLPRRRRPSASRASWKKGMEQTTTDQKTRERKVPAGGDPV